ncbi:MAG: radical SAM protein [Myxococcota bacterium]|nr:radical SAM protein [Myxococcota bacterium]
MSITSLTSRTSDTSLRTFSAKVLIVRIASWAEIRKAHPENVMAPIKLGYAVSLLEQNGHHVTLLDSETGAYMRSDVIRTMRTMRPDVVVLHGITTAVPSIIRMGVVAREILPDALLVASGQHATARPQDYLHANSPFQACPLYEYEESIAEIVEGWSMGRLEHVHGIALPDGGGGLRRTPPRPLREDLDALPYPRHELFMRGEYTVFHPTDVRTRRRWGFLMASRGCPYPCLYCSPTLRNSYGRKMRYRSAENIAGEMEYLARLGATVLHFKDDIFTVNRDHVLTLCEEIQRRGLKISWTVQTRADCVDRELLTAMRAAGCCTVSMGIESGSPRVLKVLRKRETVEDALEATRLVRDAGMFLVNFYLLANPTETLEEMEMTLKLAKKLDPDLLQVGFFTPYPGSPYYEEVFKTVDDRSPDEFSHYNKIINVSEVQTPELFAFQKRFYREMIFRPKFLARFASNRLIGMPANLQQEARFFSLSARFLLSNLRRRATGKQ